MISIREDVFETNSSSMHCLTVACPLDDQELYKNYLIKELERWKTPNGYDIKVECDENKMDDGDFAIRAYIPHFTINDKLMYVMATIVQHYWKEIKYPPYKNWNFENLTKEEQDSYWAERKEWEKHIPANLEVVQRFKESWEQFEDSLRFKIANILKLQEEDVKVQLKIRTTKEGLIYFNDKEEWFSTGCYGNEEFYHSIFDRWVGPAEWIVNPYSAVLAGSDEQDTLDTMLQNKEAMRCMDESYAHAKTYETVEETIGYLEDERRAENTEKIDTIIQELKAGKKYFTPNSSKLVWPIGG